jgi:hypothetical protein
MIPTPTIKELTEDEYLLLWSICNYITNQWGLVCNPKWIGMFKVDRLLPYIERVNTLKEEYVGLKDSLVAKLKQATP